jgi:transposase
VLQAAGLRDEALGELLRREGLHEATLLDWRAAALEGIAPRKPHRADQKRIAKLEKELARKDKALAEAAALLILQKKVRDLWGDGDDDTPPKNDE